MVNVQVTSRGDVPQRFEEIAQEKVGSLDRLVKRGVLGARVVLTREANPRLEHPAHAEGEINLKGKVLHARSSAASMEGAIDELAERLKVQLRRHVDRMVTEQRRRAKNGRLPAADDGDPDDVNL